MINYISIVYMYYRSLGLASTLHWGRANKNVLIFNQKYYL